MNRQNRIFILGLIFFLCGAVASAINIDYFYRNGFDVGWIRYVMLPSSLYCCFFGYFKFLCKVT